VSARLLLKWFFWISGSLIVASGVVFLFLEQAKWNQASVVEKPINGKFDTIGGRFAYTLSCNCPNFIIERDSKDLSYNLTLTRLSGSVTKRDVHSEIQAEGAAVGIKIPSNMFQDVSMLPNGDSISLPFTVKLEGAKPDLSQIDIRLMLVSNGDSREPPLPFYSWIWPIQSKPPFSKYVAPYVYASIVLCALGILAFWLNRRLRILREKTEQRLSAASSLAEANPEAARFAWDLARVKLEAYFDRNLIQVNLVFWVASIVMAVGFSFVLAGVWLSYESPDSIKPALVAAISGIITQFIGATFMVIYKSTMGQANEFMTVLERINNVGMAVQVLDALKDGTDLKDQTRAEIARLLLSMKGHTSPADQIKSGSV